MPGLLQTAEYTRAVVRAYDPFLEEEAAEARVAARRARAHIFENPRKPRYWAEDAHRTRSEDRHLA
ncbi:Scr1 family TA system antitoxin-like transcriptional regulator [Streptomyces sp. ATCC 21386]|uniref:Scr1 family TA system antitoxin-like transcriptional regulator n=1 Tax=Streptomyces sp. ATCC 21386 TaxID=2699428 RepID=UPI0027E41DD3|nr:Scr1 family TA system antitoxin-like transcriptional regulator [Streptomyces sp. ATCC 21386]